MKCGVLLNFTKASKNIFHNVCFKGKKKFISEEAKRYFNDKKEYA